MWFSPSNDRTAHRQVSPVMEQADGAFMIWLRQQQRMLESWESELVSCATKDETLVALQAHKTWLNSILKASD